MTAANVIAAIGATGASWALALAAGALVIAPLAALAGLRRETRRAALDVIMAGCDAVPLAAVERRRNRR